MKHIILFTLFTACCVMAENMAYDSLSPVSEGTIWYYSVSADGAHVQGSFGGVTWTERGDAAIKILYADTSGDTISFAYSCDLAVYSYDDYCIQGICWSTKELRRTPEGYYGKIFGMSSDGWQEPKWFSMCDDSETLSETYTADERTYTAYTAISVQPESKKVFISGFGLVKYVYRQGYCLITVTLDSMFIRDTVFYASVYDEKTVMNTEKENAIKSKYSYNPGYFNNAADRQCMQQEFVVLDLKGRIGYRKNACLESMPAGLYLILDSPATGEYLQRPRLKIRF